MRFEGERAVIAFHEEERRGFRNVYLDAIKAAPRPRSHDDDAPDEGHRADETAWDTALQAAPWIVGTPEPQEALPAEELYERLHPFKELVADDIRRSGSDDQDESLTSSYGGTSRPSPWRAS
jgi:hypothetical protein